MLPRPTRRYVLAGLAAAPWVASQAWAQDPLSIVATTGMIADTARTLGGEAVTVRALMGPGVDPHAYRQTRSDIAALVNADLILWHGLYLEAQMEEFLLELGRRKPVVAVGDRIPPEFLLAHDEYPDRYDPHVWMDPALWTQVANAIAEALLTVRPDLPVEPALEAYTRELSPPCAPTPTRCWPPSPKAPASL